MSREIASHWRGAVALLSWSAWTISLLALAPEAGAQPWRDGPLEPPLDLPLDPLFEAGDGILDAVNGTLGTPSDGFGPAANVSIDDVPLAGPLAIPFEEPLLSALSFVRLVPAAEVDAEAESLEVIADCQGVGRRDVVWEAFRLVPLRLVHDGHQRLADDGLASFTLVMRPGTSYLVRATCIQGFSVHSVEWTVHDQPVPMPERLRLLDWEIALAFGFVVVATKAVESAFKRLRQGVRRVLRAVAPPRPGA